MNILFFPVYVIMTIHSTFCTIAYLKCAISITLLTHNFPQKCNLNSNLLSYPSSKTTEDELEIMLCIIPGRCMPPAPGDLSPGDYRLSYMFIAIFSF